MNDVVRLALLGPEERTSALLPALKRVRAIRVDNETCEAAIALSFEDACRAAEDGKHVFLASPCMESAEQSKTLVELCRSKGITLAVGGLPRNSPACAPMIVQFSSGRLGDPGLLRVHRWSCDAASSSPALLFGDIDLTLHVFDENPTEIFALGRDDHAYLQIHLGFSNGGTALLDFARGLPAGRGYDSVSLIGSSGAAYADDHHNSHLLFTGGDPKTWISDSGNGLVAEVEAFANCIIKKQALEVAGERILRVHRVIAAIESAMESSEVMHHQRGDVYGRV